MARVTSPAALTAARPLTRPAVGRQDRGRASPAGRPLRARPRRRARRLLRRVQLRPGAAGSSHRARRSRGPRRSGGPTTSGEAPPGRRALGALRRGRERRRRRRPWRGGRRGESRRPARRGRSVGRGRGHDPAPSARPAARRPARSQPAPAATDPSSAISAWARSRSRGASRTAVGLGGVERAQHERPPGRGRRRAQVVGQHGSLIGSLTSASSPAFASSARRMASRPSRIRLLTVPSGVPVRSAISCWVSPPK